MHNPWLPVIRLGLMTSIYILAYGLLALANLNAAYIPMKDSSDTVPFTWPLSDGSEMSQLTIFASLTLLGMFLAWDLPSIFSDPPKTRRGLQRAKRRNEIAAIEAAIAKYGTLKSAIENMIDDFSETNYLKSVRVRAANHPSIHALMISVSKKQVGEWQRLVVEFKKLTRTKYEVATYSDVDYQEFFLKFDGLSKDLYMTSFGKQRFGIASSVALSEYDPAEA